MKVYNLRCSDMPVTIIQAKQRLAKLCANPVIILTEEISFHLVMNDKKELEIIPGSMIKKFKKNFTIISTCRVNPR